MVMGPDADPIVEEGWARLLTAVCCGSSKMHWRAGCAGRLLVPRSAPSYCSQRTGASLLAAWHGLQLPPRNYGCPASGTSGEGGVHLDPIQVGSVCTPSRLR